MTTTTRPFRSVLHGVCLVNGEYRDPKMARECPVLQRARRRGAKSSRSARNEAPRTEIAGSPDPPSDAPAISDTSETIRRDIAGRAFRPGRPRLPAAERHRRERERKRRWRAGAPAPA